MTVPSSTDERLAKLERSSARWRGAALGLTAVISVIALAAAGPSNGTPLAPHSLTDKNGTVRWSMALDDAGNPVQTFRDAKGKDRLKFFIDDEGTSRIRFYDEAGTARIGLFACPADHKDMPGLAGIGVIAPDNKAAITLQALGDGSVVQNLIDGTRTIRVQSYVTPFVENKQPSEAGFGLFTPAGQPFCTHFTNANGSGFLARDNAGKTRWSVNVMPNGIVNQRLCDPDEKLRHVVASTGDHNVYQAFFDREGKTKAITKVDASGQASFGLPTSTIEQLFAQAGIDASVLESLRLLSK